MLPVTAPDHLRHGFCRWRPSSRLAGTRRGDRPLEGTGGHASVLVEQALDGKAPSGVGEPTRSPCDRRDFYNGENARGRYGGLPGKRSGERVAIGGRELVGA